MSEIDLKVFISFLTLQLALGGFLSQFSLDLSGKNGTLADADMYPCHLLFKHNTHFHTRQTSGLFLYI